MTSNSETCGRYVLDERIAIGGMAEVFRARRLGAAGFSREVCIKRIVAQHSLDRSFVEMLRDEARIGARLRHCNIVAVEDFGEHDAQHFICMEFVAGMNLRTLLRVMRLHGRKFPIEAAVHITTSLLKALDHAHRQLDECGRTLGIVHRDVSPANVLLSYDGEVKLGDFGIAKATGRLHQTAGHVVKGKFGYMAPEQARGEAVDARTDLFALGVVIFEVLTGKVPFEGRDPVEVIANSMIGRRATIRSLRKDTPRMLEVLVDRLLEPDPARRHASADQALGDLESLREGARGADALAQLLAVYSLSREATPEPIRVQVPPLPTTVSRTATALAESATQPGVPRRMPQIPASSPASVADAIRSNAPVRSMPQGASFLLGAFTVASALIAVFGVYLRVFS